METINLTTIKKEVRVEASQAVAFKVFTEKMDSWWPKTHHIGTTPMTQMVVEPHPNGRWYSKHEDGSEASVGYVMQYDPYSFFALAWQIDGEYRYNPDVLTEVEVQFIAEGPKTTFVKFEHKNLQRLGGTKAVEGMDNGWGTIMGLYKQAVENEG